MSTVLRRPRVEVAGIYALHDRNASGVRADIVIGPSVVFVIDAKRHEGQIHRYRVGGQLRWSSALFCSPSRCPIVDYRESRSDTRGRCLAIRLRKDGSVVTTGIR